MDQWILGTQYDERTKNWSKKVIFQFWCKVYVSCTVGMVNVHLIVIEINKNKHVTRLMVLISTWRIIFLDRLYMRMTKNYFEKQDINSFWKKHQYRKAGSYFCRGEFFKNSAVYVIQGAFLCFMVLDCCVSSNALCISQCTVLA